MSSGRVVILKVSPQVDEGQHPAKAVLGELFKVTAIIICDGHETLKARLHYRKIGTTDWRTVPMRLIENDLWHAAFPIESIVGYEYTVEASLDTWMQWKKMVLIKMKAAVLEALDIAQGVLLFDDAVGRAPVKIRRVLTAHRETLTTLQNLSENARLTAFLDQDEIAAAFENVPEPTLVKYGKVLTVRTDPVIAKFSAWYEFFPRSFGEAPGKHGTFKSALSQLDYAADLGFDVIYLPPIHPIGQKNRKGKNNSLVAEADDVGSPWAIGDKTGGHKAVHPALGTLEDFKKFNAHAEKLNLKIALDIAFQCAPDHPYLTSNPEWFKKRADGTIQFAENPPKKYEDIYPFDFYCENRQALWNELKSVFEFWISQGVTVFRVDNPHTKPFEFWHWLITDLKIKNPDLVFLSEAFTRPNIMKYLAKIGFSQSYTYFTWRLKKAELQTYALEMADPELSCYLRSNFWPNTPDILSGPLRNGTFQDYQIRYLLAATLSPSYGVYGPAFELIQNNPRDNVSEEYLNSEKYQLINWNLKTGATLAPLIKKINGIRRAHPAFQHFETLRFHDIPNEKLLAFSISHLQELILVIINLDPAQRHYGTLRLPSELHHPTEHHFDVKDILNGDAYRWQGNEHYIELDPAKKTAHIFLIKKNSEPLKMESSLAHHA